MAYGKSYHLRLRKAARLQDAIRSLGKHRIGDKKMSEVIRQAEELLSDGIQGVKPMVLMTRAAYLGMSIAAMRNSECNTAEYGIGEYDGAYWRLVEARRAQREEALRDE